MKHKLKISLAIILFFATSIVNAANEIPVYRFYNPGSGDHFFTTSLAEGQNALGYVYEGIGFMYLVYNSATLPHFIAAGWEVETMQESTM
ncbi:MAG: hypothetical protein ACREO8_04175 [Luteimonas sp.]